MRKIVSRLCSVILILSLSQLITSCASNPYNPTVFPYEINESVVKSADFKRLIIAPINIGKPSRLYLQKREKYIDKMVEAYLRKHGYVVMSSRLFMSRWEEALDKYGEVYDPTTDRFTRAYHPALAETIAYITQNSNIDGVVFTDLLEIETQFSDGINHVARWHGVSRKPALQGPGTGVPYDFNWGAAVKAATLFVNIFDASLQRVFMGAGGLELLDAVDMKSSSPDFVRRRDILENDTQIREGIQLAFHPLIEWSGYPRAEP